MDKFEEMHDRYTEQAISGNPRDAQHARDMLVLIEAVASLVGDYNGEPVEDEKPVEAEKPVNAVDETKTVTE